LTSSQIALLMVTGGVALLLSALRPVKRICAYEDQRQHGWGVIFHLILLFICGYATFGYYLITSETAFIELVVAMVFLGGGWFVSIVSQLSLNTIIRFDDAVQTERYRALHDPLTSLPNRILFYERIDQVLVLAKRERKEVAIMIIDLNEFKEVNDTLGHQGGDELLLLATKRLKGLMRESDTLARFGGDEFAVILPNSSKEQAHTLAERLTSSILDPFLIEESSLIIGMSVGIAMYPQHGLDSRTLIKHADIAMYNAKRYQKAFSLYNDTMEDAPSLNLSLNLVSRSPSQRPHAVAEKQLLN